MSLQYSDSLSPVILDTGAQKTTGSPRTGGKTTPLDAAVIDRIVAEEGADGVKPTVMGIYGQESGGGTNAVRSVDGALGGMQIIPATFNRFAKPGERIDNPEDNFRVGVRYLKSMGDRFGNDPGRLAVGYFSGEGNVNPSGDTPYKEDRKDGNGKSVSSYVRDLAARVGNAATPEPKGAESAPAPDLSKIPKYRDFIRKAQWDGLTDAEKGEARGAYFDRYVAPYVPKDDLANQRQAFDARTAELEAKLPKPQGMFDRIKSGVAEVGGAILGSMGSGTDSADGAAIDPTALATPAVAGTSKIGVAGAKPMPAAPGASRAPVTPEFRAEMGRAFDAATPAQREQMQQADGVVGQLARERAGQFAAAPQVDTAKKFDTRAEARADRMRADGVDPTVAENFGRYGAAAGQAPGSELGTMGASNFDFETQQRFNKDPVFSNPVIRAAVKGYQGYRQGSLGLAQALFDATGNQEFADIAKQGVADAQRTTTAMGEKGDGLQRNFEGAVSSIAQQLPALLAGVATGTEVLPLAAMFTQTFGQEYGSGRAQGLDGGQAAARAGIYGAFEVIGEKFGLGQTLQALKLATKGAPTQDIATVLAQGMLREIPGEQLTTLGQFLTDKVPGIGTNLEAGLAQYLQQAGDTLAQTVMQGGLMMGGTTGVSAGVRHLQGDPTQTSQDLAAEQAREQALNKSAAFFQSPARPKHASTAAAEQVVREMAAEAGIDPAELLPAEKPAPVAPMAAAQAAPAATAPQAQPSAAPAEQGAAAAGQPAFDPREVMDFAQTRYERLLSKRDGEALVQTGEDGRPVDGEVAGQALTPDEQQELAVLDQSGGDAGALARFYGFDEDTANVSPSPVSSEPVDSRGAAPDAGVAADQAAGRAGPVPGGDGRSARAEATGTPHADAVPGADGAADGQPPLTFKTAKGSVYRVAADGTTSRDKAYRPEHGAAEQGPQPASQRTFYVDDAGLHALGEFQAKGEGRRIVSLPDGSVGVQYTTGPDSGRVERRTVVTPISEPRVGLHPVELWKDGDVVHFGNKITEVSGAAPATTEATAAPPAAAAPAEMSDEQLQARLDYMQAQARANGGWNKMGADERNRVEAELGRRAAAQPAPDAAQALDAAAHEAATSPANSLPEPTDAQKQAGNYKMGHATLHGLDITIENPRGSTRSGTDADGKAWSVEMANHYGYIKRTEGADGDHIDVFIGPKPESTKVFVVDQVDPRTGKYDEHKVLMGFSSLAAARAGYLANYEQGWKGAGAITPMSMDEFKAWLKEGDTTKPLNAKVGKPKTERQAKAAREQAKPATEVQAPDAAAAPLPISPSNTSAAASPPAKPKPKTEKQLRAERADAAPVAKGAANKAVPAEDRPLFSRAPATNTEAFKRWFGKSEIVDAAGKPRVMYHGTGADIASLQGKQAGAIFLTYAPSVAEGYAHTSTQWLADHGMEGAPNILPVYVKAENPFDYESAKHRTQLITAAIAGGKTYVMGDGRRAMLGEDGNRTLYTVGAIEAGLTTGANNWSLIEEPWFRDAIKRAGFDSFYVHEEGFKNLGVYEPSQVKSATGNIGAFDASNPDIRFRRGAPAGRLNAEDLRAQFAPIIKQWQNGPKGGVEVVQSVDDLPSHLAEALRSAGEDGRVEGFYLPKSDKVYLIAGNLPSAERAQQVAFHEVYGHKGLRAILPAEQYAAMMDRIQRANPKIAAAADDWFDAYGGDTIRMNRAAGQAPAEARRNAELLAVEEALADMAATVPVAGPVRKLLAALQAGLRKIGLHAVADWLEGKTEAETFALLRDARAAVFGKTSKGETHVSQAPADDAAPAFSRSRDGAQMNLFRLFQRDEGSVDTMGKWDRTVGTQYNKALKDQHFGKVFGYALAMQNEVSMASIRPAELAPGLLHKVDGFKPALRALVLGRKRDKELEGATMAIFSGSTAGATVAQGQVWKDEDLRSKFGLTDRGIRLYKQARSAINASLDEVAAAEAYAMSQGFVPKGLRRMVMDDPAGARGVLMGSLDKQIRMLERATKAAARGKSAEEQASNLDTVLEPYIATRDRLEEIFERAASLKLAGYAPLMRFGKYTVYANEVGPNGEVLRDENDDAKSLYFGIFETEAEAIRKADELRAKYADQGNVRVTRGKKDQKGHELFSGISPETVALFGDVVGRDEATKQFYQKALSERSALKRRLGRRAVDGYSTDLPRVLSNFITSNGRFAAQRYYLRDLNNAIRTIPKSKGDVKDEAIELRNYLMDANDAGSGASSLMFAYFLGGSVASAVVNLTQPFMMTAPYLSQWGAARTTAAMTKAMPYALSKKQIADPDLRAALRRGSQEGIVDAQEIFHLYSQGAQTVSASIASRLAKIPKVGKGLQSSTDSARARLEGFFTLWGSMFAAAESFNRKLTFVAAWDVAKATKQPDPYEFAVRAVNETQGIFNKVNRPNWARGTTGRLLMTFKQYSIMYLELTRRMWRAGPAGKRAVLMMMAVLFLAGGEEGLPFAQDINDLVDTIGQSLGYDTNLLRDKRKWAHKILGQTGGDFALYGVSSMMPLDFAGRLGMGNLIPGTGLLKPAESADRTREVTDVIGPAGALVSSAMDSYDAWSAKQPGRAVMALMPKAINNAAAGIEMAMTDKAVDYKGRKVTDVGLGDAIIKGVGFTPTKVSEDTRRRMPARQDISLVKKVQADIVDLWTRGLAEGDKDMQERAAAWFRDWNEKNPDSPIQITNRQLLGKVKQMATPSADRMLKAAPKGLRGRLAGELAAPEDN